MMDLGLVVFFLLYPFADLPARAVPA